MINVLAWLDPPTLCDCDKAFVINAIGTDDSGCPSIPAIDEEEGPSEEVERPEEAERPDEAEGPEEAARPDEVEKPDEAEGPPDEVVSFQAGL